MILFINTSKTDLIELKLIDKNQVIGRLESREEYKQAELLLPMIDQLFQQTKKKNKDLRAIAVISGPGAFSALRFGITTANMLGWSLQIPVVEISVSQSESDEELILSIENKLKKLKNFSPVIPKYGREPNITKAKK